MARKQNRRGRSAYSTNNRRAAARRRAGKEPLTFALDQLEPRVLLSYSFTWNAVTHTDTITGDNAADNLVIAINGGGQLEHSENGGPFSTDWNTTGVATALTPNASYTFNITPGTGADTVQFGLAGTTAASALLVLFNMFAPVGNNTGVVIDDTTSSATTTYLISTQPGIITSSTGFNYDEGASQPLAGGITLDGSNGSDTYDVLSVIVTGTEPVTINAGESLGNVVNLGSDPGTPSDSTLGDIGSLVTVNDLPGLTTLNLLDAGDTASADATITGTTVTGLGFVAGGSVTYAGGVIGGINPLNIDGGTNGGSGVTYNVNGTAAYTTINGGANANTYNLSNSGEAGGLSNLVGAVVINGGGGGDAIYLNDQDSGASDSYTVTSTTVTSTSTFGGLTYGGLGAGGSLTLNAETGNNTIEVDSTSVPTTLNGDNGDNVFNIGGNGGGGDLNNIAGALTIDGGAGTTNTINMYDQSDGGGFTYTVTNGSVTRTGGFAGLNYSNTQILVLDSSTGVDTFDVTSTIAEGNTTINDEGDATFNVSGTGAFSTNYFNGGVGDDTFNITADGMGANSSNTFNGNDGNDTFIFLLGTTPVTSTATVYINGGNPTTSTPASVGDTIFYQGPGYITPDLAVVGSGTITDAGGTNIQFTGIETATTVDAGVSPVFVPGLGWVVTATGDQSYPDQNDNFEIATTVIAGSTWVEFIDNGVVSFIALESNVYQFNVNGLGGNDNLTVDSTFGLVTPAIFYDGGTGFNTLTLQGGTATADVYTAGPNPGEGVSTITTGGDPQTVSFQNLSPVFDLVAGPLTVANAPPAIPMSGSNAITYTVGINNVSFLSDPTFGMVTVDNQEYVDFTNKTTLELDGGNGNDVFTLANPDNTPTGLTGITVNGVAAPGSDTLIVNGATAVTGNIDFVPTGPEAGEINGTGVSALDAVPITFGSIEQVEINGQGAGDTLSVTTPAASVITYTPGATADSGSVQVGSLVAMSFENLGGIGVNTVTLFDAVGSLVYNGTGNNDEFIVSPVGVITLTGYLPVATTGITGLQLNDPVGNNEFFLSGSVAFPYGVTGIAVDPSASNRVTLTGDGAAATVNMYDPAYPGTTVSGGDLGLVVLSGVELVNLTNTIGLAAGVTVNGTVGVNNTISVSQVDATDTAFTEAGHNTTLVVDAGAGALVLDPGFGTNSVTYTAPVGSVTAINPTLASVATTGYKTLALIPADVESLNVSGQDGNFSVTTPVPATMALTVDGSGLSALTVDTSGATNVAPDLPGNAGAVASGTSGVSYVGMESVVLIGAGGPTDTLSVLGTTGNDAITQNGNLVAVNNSAPVSFSGYTALTINGTAGSDVINVSPAGLPAAIAAFNVIGGAGNASEVVVNGSGAAETINFTPTGPEAAGVKVGAFTTVNITTTELVEIVGAGNDNLQVTTPAATPLTYSPGATVDSGSVQAGSLVPMSFLNLGAASSVTLSDAGGSLVYNGTAGDDTFGVSAAGIITLNNQLAVTPTGIIAVTLSGLDGDNTFNVHAGFAYALTLDPSGSGVANLIGATGAVTVTLANTDGATPTTVSGYGGLVTLMGVEVLNADAAGNFLTVVGTSASENIDYTPTGAAAGTVTEDGLSLTVNVTNVSAAVGGFTINSGAGSDSLLSVYGTQAGEAIAVNGATSTVTVAGLLPVFFTNTASVSVYGQDGSDTFTVTPSATVPFYIDGGNPIGVQPGDQLIINTPAAPTATNFFAGPLIDEGGFSFTGGPAAQAVSFANIESVAVVGAPGGGPLVVNGTNANNAIDYVEGQSPLGTLNPAYGRVLIDNQPPIDFTNVTVLTINGLGGDDVINLNNPFVPNLLTGINVDGGDPTASDKVIVNGTGAGETINFAPTGPEAASVTVGAAPTVSITDTELVDIVGDGNDNLLVTTPGANTITYSPGAAVDSGSVQVDSFVPMSFENLGINILPNTVTLSDAAGSLVYNGTPSDDTFTVSAADVIGLNNQLKVTTTGITGLTLNGLDGNNTFNLTGGYSYTSVTVDPAGFNVVNLTGTGALATVTMNSSTGLTGVVGGGLGSVTLSGVEQVNLNNAGAGGVTVQGTPGANNAFAVSQVDATDTAFTLAGLDTTLVADAVGGALTLNAVGGTTSDSATYTGTAGPDSITINPTAGTVALPGYQTLTLTLPAPGSALALDVDGGDGADSFFVTTAVPARVSLTVDGGSPTTPGAGDTLNVTTLGATTVTPGATGDAGSVASVTNGTVNFVGIESVSLTGTAVDALTIDGTNGADAINQSGDTVTVNNDAPITFATYNSLTLKGLAGDDVINVNPTTLVLAGLAPTFTVDGGDPTASDKVIVNGTAVGADAINYTPTSTSGGTVTVNGFVTTILNTEQLVINGLGSTTTGDLLTVTAPASSLTTYAPGLTADSGGFQVNDFLPMSFTNLGSDGEAVTLSAGLASSLVYNGTAGNDAFAVTGIAGPTGQVALTTAGLTYLPVQTNVNVANLTINGISGSDTFTVTGTALIPYTAINLNGGASLNDVATLNGTGADITATLNATTQNVGVTGGNLSAGIAGVVTLSSIELVNVNAATNNIIVDSAGGGNPVMTVNPIALRADSVAVNGLDTVLNADPTLGTLTVGRPVGGTQEVVVNGGTNGADNPITVAQGAPTVVTVPGYLAVNVVTAQTSTLQVNGLDGADTFTVTGSGGPNLVINGGSPGNFGGADVNTLNVTTAGGTTVTQGATGDAGAVVSTNGTVSFTGIGYVALTGAAGTTLAIDGTNGSDAIDQTGNVVTVNNGAPVDFSAGAYSELDIYGLGGDDVINVNPAGLAAAITTFRVDGGDPTASDKVIVNGTGAINFTPTGPAAASVTVGAHTVLITTTEQVVINGQPGPDVLTVTGGASPITYNPGATVDSGSVQVASLVPLSFENLGAGGSVTLSTTGSVVYNGTANNDTFVVNAADVITLNSQLPVTTVGVTNLTLNGVSGDDTFNVTGGGSYTYTNLILSGGASLNDVANLTGGGTAVNLNNLGGTTANVTGGGLGTVSLPSIEVLNLNAGSTAAAVFGTSGPDNWTVTPTGANSAIIQASGFSPLTYLTGATALTLDPSGGGDQITVNGTPGNDTINVVRGLLATTVQVNPPWLTATVAADTTGLVVAAGTGDDVINVTETGVSPTGLTVNGGLPTASDTLNFTNDANGTTELKPGSTPDSGVVVAADLTTISFLGIEKISLTGLAPSASNTLLIDGTAGSDLISLYNTGSGNTAQVNSQAPVTFAAFGAVALNGISGDDTFNVSPVGLTNVTAIAVNGAATGTAAVNVNGSAATETITVAMGAVPTVSGLGALVTITNPTSIAINGFGGNDNLTVTTPVNSAITYTPGATVDSASMQVNSLAPLSFSGLGSSGTVTLTGTGTASLAYNGTAVDDTFTVSALNVIKLNSQLQVTTSGITALTLNGLAGNNTFNLTGGYAYTTVTLDPSGSGVANLTGNGVNPVALNNLGGTTANVTGGGLGTVSLSGVGVLNLNAATTAATVFGTTGPDNFSVTPTGTNAATIQATGFFPVTYLTNAASLLVNTLGGSDLLSVYGTQGSENITVNGTTSTVTVAGLLPVVYANTASVSVYGQDGSDTFTVTPSATVPFYINGGNPIGVQPGDKLILNAPAATTFYAGPESDEGGFLFGTPAGSVDQAVSFAQIESVTVLGSPSAAILGTSGDDQITITARDSSYDPLADGVQDFTVEMNEAPTVLFINTPAVSVNSGAGDDLIVVHAPAPNLANWNVTVTIDGGSPDAGGSDELVVETPGNQAATYTPTGPSAGSLVVTGDIPSMTITDIEQFVYDGMGTDGLTVTGTGVFDLTPTAVDIGQVALTPTGGQQWLPVDYQEVGSLTANGTGASDTLLYNGTDANDTFTVAAGTGTVTLVDPSGSYIPVLETGLKNLTINALTGDDTFNVAGGQPYTSVNLDGGGDPTANLTGATGAVTVTFADSVLDTNTTVTGYGGTITLSGVDVLNANANSNTVTIDGTAEADSITYTPTGALAGTVTNSGLNLAVNISNVSAAAGAFTIDPVGSSPANTVTVNDTAGNDTINVINNAAKTRVQVTVDALLTANLVTADTQSLVIAGGNGNDALTVDSSNGPILPAVQFNGGLGFTNSLTLQDTGTAATSDTYTPGPQAGSGNSTIGFAAGTQVVNFVNLKPVTDTVPSPTLTVFGTSADNAIGYSVGANATLGRVTIDDQEYIDFNNKTQLTINGLGGNDQFTLNNTNTPTGLSTTIGTPGITVGGNTTAIDTVTANGTAGADAINFTPTSASGGTITGAGPVTISFTTTQQVVINGQGGGDTLTVTTPSGANTVRYTPGAAPDAGAVLVNSLVPMSFLNIGATGTVQMSNAASTRSDTLIYNGTSSDNAFGITAGGNITLNGHVTVTSTGASAGVTNVTLNDISGNDTFTVASGNPYAGIAINGGPSFNDVATLTGSGVAAFAKMDPGALDVVVTGGGLASTAVTLTGVALVTLDNSALSTGSVEVDGTGINDAFTVSQVDATHTAFTLTGLNTTLVATKGATATLTLDPKADTNSVTVNGTVNADTFNVVNAALTTLVTVVGYQPLTVATADTQALYVSGGLGSDTFNVSGTGGPALTVDGGLPTASDTLNITNTNHGTTTVNPGTSPDSGTIATPDYTVPVSFVGIEHITLTGVLVGPPLTDTLVINGTSGSDLISLYNTGGGNTALVSAQAPVTFSNFGPVVLNGVGGNDTFNVSPVGLVGVTGITVNGDAPAGGTAAAIVNGSTAANTITVTATSSTTATVAIAGSPTVSIDPVSSLQVNGINGNNTFTVTDGTPGVTGPTPLAAPISLVGGPGNDTFGIGAYTGELIVNGGQGSDTLNFAGAPGDGSGFGVTVDLDMINYAQTVDADGESVNLIRPIANFVGSSFDDKVTVDATTTPRLINGGLPNLPTSPNYSTTPTPAVTGFAITGASGQFGTAVDGTYLNRGLMLNGKPIYVETSNVSNTLSWDGSNWDVSVGGTVVYSGATLPGALANNATPGYTGTASAVVKSPVPQLAAIPPGDQLTVDGEDQFVNITHTNVDSGTVVAFSYAPITFTQIEKIAVTDSLGSTGSTAGGNLALPSYTTAVPYKTDGRPVSEAVGDLNGDGINDLVVACINAIGQPVVDVFIGNGNGTFQPEVTYPVEPPNYIGGVQVVKLVDMNGDGNLDIVTLNTDSTVSELMGSGTGAFAAPIVTKLYSTPGPANSSARLPIAMAVGDINNDGFPDLVTANYGSASVTVLTNNGSGVLTPLTYKSGGSYPSDVALMDVNGDGLLDIMVVDRGTWTMAELWNQPATPGVFGPVNPINPLLARVPTTLNLVNKEKSPIFSIQTTDNYGNYLDFNQDGIPDVLLSTLNGSAVTILEGNSSTSSTGAFTVAPQVVYTGTVASAVVSAQAADLNGDGKLDIVLTGRHMVQVLVGNGNGTFSAPMALSLPSQINLGPQKPLLVDLNNDGGIDILSPDVLTHAINVLLRSPLI